MILFIFNECTNYIEMAMYWVLLQNITINKIWLLYGHFNLYRKWRNFRVYKGWDSLCHCSHENWREGEAGVFFIFVNMEMPDLGKQCSSTSCKQLGKYELTIFYPKTAENLCLIEHCVCQWWPWPKKSYSTVQFWYVARNISLLIVIKPESICGQR